MARPKRKPRGLGDVVENITTTTGIKAVVKAIAGEDCGCDERKEWLNKHFPIGRKVKECLTEEDSQYLSEFFKKVPSYLYPVQQRELGDIYSRVFGTRIETSCSDCWRQYIKDLRTLYENKDEKTI